MVDLVASLDVNRNNCDACAMIFKWYSMLKSEPSELLTGATKLLDSCSRLSSTTSTSRYNLRISNICSVGRSFLASCMLSGR